MDPKQMHGVYSPTASPEYEKLHFNYFHLEFLKFPTLLLDLGGDGLIYIPS